jgi:4-hydroxy-4-methyl-2-oxoglutarate aldolase
MRVPLCLKTYFNFIKVSKAANSLFLFLAANHNEHAMMRKAMANSRFPAEVIDGFLKVSASNVSDACDRLSIDGAVRGILPLIPCGKIVGHAATLKLTKAGGEFDQSPVNGTLKAIAVGGAGAVLVVDGRENPTVNCFGGIAGATAKHTGLVGCVADGPMRDIDEYKGYGLPVYGRGIVQQSIRGRSALQGYDIPVEIGGVTVHPNDLVFADDNGVVVVPRARVEDVLRVALVIKATEDRFIAAIRSGEEPIEAHAKVNYDELLKPQQSQK